MTAFMACAVGNSVGLGVMTGGAVRMHLYMAAGLDTGQVFRIMGFNAGAFGLGGTAFGAGIMLPVGHHFDGDMAPLTRIALDMPTAAH